MARELHDVLAHTLSALSLQLEALDALVHAGPQPTPEVNEQLQITKRLGRVGLTEAGERSGRSGRTPHRSVHADPGCSGRSPDPHRRRSGPDASAARRPHRARGRSPRSHRPGNIQQRDRLGPLRRRGHGQNPRQPHLRQDPQPRPSASSRLRPPPRSHARLMAAEPLRPGYEARL
jgi:hypothetical protein